MEQVPALVVNESKFMDVFQLFRVEYFKRFLFRSYTDPVSCHHGVHSRHEAQLRPPPSLSGGQSKGQDDHRDGGLGDSALPGENTETKPLTPSISRMLPKQYQMTRNISRTLPATSRIRSSAKLGPKDGSLKVSGLSKR